MTAISLAKKPQLRPLSDAWRLDCIDHWAQSVDFWTRYPDAPESRSGLNNSYAKLSDHMHYLMRADSRPDF